MPLTHERPDAPRSLFMPRRHVLIILVLMIATLSMVNAAQKDRFYDQNRRFSRILSLIMNSYYKEVDADVLFEGAYQGMLSELDPYCQYFSEKEYKSFTEDTSGKFGGLGIEIGLRDGILTVITPIAGTPAYEAGVMPGDKILKIDGESTERISLQEALNILRGEPGSSVTISVRHRDSDINKDITIVRAVIKPAIIEFNLAAEEPKIGIIKVYSFTSEMIKQFDDAADALKRDKIQGIIQDSGFSSPTEFIVYILRDLVGEQLAERGRKADPDRLTAEEIAVIKKRLRSLGYL